MSRCVCAERITLIRVHGTTVSFGRSLTCKRIVLTNTNKQPKLKTKCLNPVGKSVRRGVYSNGLGTFCRQNGRAETLQEHVRQAEAAIYRGHAMLSR